MTDIGIGLVVAGTGAIFFGLYFAVGGVKAYHETDGYRSAEWLSEMPHHGCMLGWFLFVWVAMAIAAIIQAVNGGRLPVVVYVITVVGLFVVWWLVRAKVAHQMERAMELIVQMDDSQVRKEGIVFVIIGVILVIVGLIKLR